MTSSSGASLPKRSLPRGEQPTAPEALALMEKSPDSEGQLRFTVAGRNFLQRASGCNSIALGRRFLRQAVPGAGRGESIDERLRRFEEAGAFMASLDPADAIEGALAAQLYALHAAAMRSLSQAADATDDRGVDLYMNRATKLLRAFAQQSEAWKRHRGRGQQTVRVEHVHVNAGGQAIVGAVNAGGGSKSKK
jgi:hypothetical protein